MMNVVLGLPLLVAAMVVVAQSQMLDDSMFDNWVSNYGGPVYLTERQAAWWYSLGAYRPSMPGEDKPHCPATYKPDYTEVMWRQSEAKTCELIRKPIRTRREFRSVVSVVFYPVHASFCGTDIHVSVISCILLLLIQADVES